MEERTAAALEFLAALTVICEAVKHNVDVGDWVDLFADAYMDAKARNENLKQDFTPKGVAALMSRLAFLDNCVLPECGYFTLSDHACGSGTLLLSSDEYLNLMGFNPSAVNGILVCECSPWQTWSHGEPATHAIF